jgi:hypothetical protein
MRRRLAAVLFALAAGLVLSSAIRLARAAEEQKWGTIKGQVVLDGDIPAPVTINVDKDQEHCLSKGPIHTETWVVNPKNKGVRWAYAWLLPTPDPDDPAKKKEMPIHPKLREVPTDPVVMDQPCCRFEPHALAMRQGQTWIAKNSAPIPHNVHWAGGFKNPGNNIIIPPSNDIKVSDLVANIYPVSVKCDIHGWMQAWIRVFDHPYFAVTDENGDFEIKDAPAGQYNLVVWHEDAGWRNVKRLEINGKKVAIYGTPITIKPDAVTDLGKLDIKKPAQ